MREVRAAMGGEVLELLNDRAKRLEREAEERGLAQGIAQGIELGTSNLVARLKELGVDEGIIDEAMETLREKEELASSVEEE